MNPGFSSSGTGLGVESTDQSEKGLAKTGHGKTLEVLGWRHQKEASGLGTQV